MQQQPAMRIQGAIFAQSNLKPMVEPPAMTILLKPLYSQANTYSNARSTLEATSKNSLTPKQVVYASCEHDNLQELLQEKYNCSPPRTVLRKLQQHNIVQKQIDGGVSGNAHSLEETKKQISRLQLLNYASCSQDKPKPARSCRSPPLASMSNDTQYSPATRPLSDNQQSPAFIALTIHTCPMMVQVDKLTITHSMALTWPLYLMSQVSSLSLSPEHKDYQPRQTTQPTATLQSSSWQPGLMETDPTRMQWKSMHQVHLHIANWLFPQGHHSTIDIIPAELVLMWTLFQPILDTSWWHTYA